jgi:hypothetical protein
MRRKGYTPTIYTHETRIGGAIEGRDLGAPIGGIGELRIGRPNSPANVRVASQHFVEREAREFNSYDGGWLDRESGLIYDEIDSDPLFADDPSSAADVFVQWGGTIVFLKSRATTVDEVEAARADAARRADDEVERVAKFRSKQPQRPLRLDLLRGDNVPTLRRAAARIYELGGQIRRGEHGETILVTVPERLTPPSENGFEAILERELLIEAARCAEVLSYASATVIAALDSKKSLDEALPDDCPTI